jgi:putative transposase
VAEAWLQRRQLLQHAGQVRRDGPELTALNFTEWCAEKGIALRYIQPGKPNQNAFIERFNRSYRNEVLNGWVFESLDQVREITHDWLTSYNEERPHDALGNLPPTLFREQLLARQTSTSELST